jgi:hypothetical protein
MNLMEKQDEETVHLKQLQALQQAQFVHVLQKNVISHFVGL